MCVLRTCIRLFCGCLYEFSVDVHVCSQTFRWVFCGRVDLCFVDVYMCVLWTCRCVFCGRVDVCSVDVYMCGRVDM